MDTSATQQEPSKNTQAGACAIEWLASGKYDLKATKALVGSQAFFEGGEG